MQTRVWGVVLALTLVAAACGDDGSTDTLADPSPADPSSAAEPTAKETAYLEELAAIRAEVEEVSESTFDAALIDAEVRAAGSVLPEVAAALEVVIAAEADAREMIAALDPPSRFEADHERVLSFLDDRRDIQAREAAAAANLDSATLQAIAVERDSLERAYVASVSAEFAGAFGSGIAAVASLGTLDDAELVYLDEVQAAWQEFTVRVERFGQALQQTYTSDELLLRALLDAGAGEAFTAVQTVALEIEPPPSYAEAHETFMAYVDETVALDALIAEAAEAGDVVGFEVANVGLGIAGGRFELDAPPELANVITGNDFGLLGPVDVEGGEYGAGLTDVLRTFRILALSAPVTSGVFPALSDETVIAAMIEVEPTFIGFTSDAVDRLEDLDPPADYAPAQARLGVYFDELLDVRVRVLDAATTDDRETLEDLGYLGDLRLRDRAEVGLWCSARADLVDDPTWPIVEPFFEPFGGVGPIAQLCPT